MFKTEENTVTSLLLHLLVFLYFAISFHIPLLSLISLCSLFLLVSLSAEHTLCLLTHATRKHTHTHTQIQYVADSVSVEWSWAALWKYLSHFISVFTTLQRDGYLNPTLYTILSPLNTQHPNHDVTCAMQRAKGGPKSGKCCNVHCSAHWVLLDHKIMRKKRSQSGFP